MTQKQKSIPQWIKELEKLGPCPDALTWASQYPTAEEAWAACEKGDWMLWYAARAGLTEERHKLIVTAACKIAERHFDKLPSGETRLQKAVEMALKWTNGEAELYEVLEAARAAEAARTAAWAAGAAEAARTAAWAARAAGAAEAAGAAAEAAAGAAGAAEAAELKEQSNIIRKYLSCPSRG